MPPGLVRKADRGSTPPQDGVAAALLEGGGDCSAGLLWRANLGEAAWRAGRGAALPAQQSTASGAPPAACVPRSGASATASEMASGDAGRPASRDTCDGSSRSVEEVSEAAPSSTPRGLMESLPCGDWKAEVSPRELLLDRSLQCERRRDDRTQQLLCLCRGFSGGSLSMDLPRRPAADMARERSAAGSSCSSEEWSCSLGREASLSEDATRLAACGGLPSSVRRRFGTPTSAPRAAGISARARAESGGPGSMPSGGSCGGEATRCPDPNRSLGLGDCGGDSDGGRDVGSETARGRRTTMGAFTTDARLAYSSVLLESSKWSLPGCTLAIIETRQSDRSDPFRSSVSLESR
mmetsp:Transcript_50634/g.151406  ORF Transcript_50634/g.151406 Transcript_50634/m.151406 type:complete len:351 (-) Transcript_50634:1135-2187(-)